MNFAKLYSPLRLGSDHGLDDVLRMVEDMLSDEQRCRKFLEVEGDEAQECLDTLQMLADRPNVAANLRSSILKMMLHLSKRSGLCPNCLVIKNVKKLGAFPVGGGGFGDVWKGKIGEQLVCLKVVKVYLRSDLAHIMKEYIREAIVWQQLKHPNLLPFVGMYYLDKTREQLCLVSPWMERGDLSRYLKEKSRKDVDHQTLVYDVAAGLSYLHDKKIVHGDLKSVNILVTPDERACIGDFGLSRVADSHGLRLSTSTSGQPRGTIRWLAPELLEPPCHSSTRSDIYAYACVCYEIFTGITPFHELADGAVIVAVLLHKKHPNRPENIDELTDPIWAIMESCWAHEAGLRPTAENVLSRVGSLRSMKTGDVVGLQPAPDWNSVNLMQIWKNVKYAATDTTTLVCSLKKEQTRLAALSSPSLATSISPTSTSLRERSAELLTKLLRPKPSNINLQPASSDDPEPADSEDENFEFEYDDSWQLADIVPRITPSTSVTPIPASLQDRERLSPSRSPPRWHHSRNVTTTTTITSSVEGDQGLLRECMIGKGHASLLSHILVQMTPEEFVKELGGDRREGGKAGGVGSSIVEEFRRKCISSQELIAARIPWAFAGAERSRREAGEGEEKTAEEKLLGDLISANEELLATLEQYQDLERFVREIKASGEQSRNYVGGRKGRDVIEHRTRQEELHLSTGRPQPPLHVSSPIIIPTLLSPNFMEDSQVPSSQSRSSSPPVPPSVVPSPIPPSKLRPPATVDLERHSIDHLGPGTSPVSSSSGFCSADSDNGGMYSDGGKSRRSSVVVSSDDDEWQDCEEFYPSGRALGKRRAVEDDVEKVEDDFAHLGVNGHSQHDRFDVNRVDEERREEEGFGYARHHSTHSPVQYVYDDVVATARRVSPAPEVA